MVDSNKKIDQIDQLYEQVKEYRRSADFQRMMQEIAKMPTFSPYNAMLLQMQKPGSYYVTTVSRWRKRFNRNPKPGARPLVILRPFGPIDFVYEYSDTEGDEIPPNELKAFFSVTNDFYRLITPDQLECLQKNLLTEGIRYREEDYGSSLQAKIMPIKEKKLVYETRKSKHYVKLCACIVVNRKLDEEQKYAAIIHELGHFFCGHLGRFNQTYLPERDRLGLSKEIVEFEAETACWLCCQRLGIASDSVEYLAEYARENDTIPDVKISVILQAAGLIEKMLHKHNMIRRQLEEVIKINNIKD